MDLTLANFGYIPYGKNVFGTVYLADPINACLPLNSSNFMKNSRPIILIKRGGCTFVTKAYYAQLVGAKLALVYDSVTEDEHNIHMVDDGYGIYFYIITNFF